jgi:hypothetical protein
MSKRIPGLPNVWQEYITCIALHMVLPLLPLALEFSTKDSISAISATLAAAMYTISIGLSSKSKAIFSICFLLCIFYTYKYGSLQSIADIKNHTDGGALWGIFGAFLMHALERYNIHVADNIPFWNFSTKEAV